VIPTGRYHPTDVVRDEELVAMADGLELDSSSQPPVYMGSYHTHLLVVPAVDLDPLIAERAKARHARELHDLPAAEMHRSRDETQADVHLWARQRRYHMPNCPGCVGRVRGVGGVPGSRQLRSRAAWLSSARRTKSRTCRRHDEQRRTARPCWHPAQPRHSQQGKAPAVVDDIKKKKMVEQLPHSHLLPRVDRYGRVQPGRLSD